MESMYIQKYPFYLYDWYNALIRKLALNFNLISNKSIGIYFKIDFIINPKKLLLNFQNY